MRNILPLKLSFMGNLFRFLFILFAVAGIFFIILIIYSKISLPDEASVNIWWTALVILVALYLSGLIINFYSGSEVLKLTDMCKKNEEDIKKLTRLSNFSSFIIDINADDTFFEQDGWNVILNDLEILHKDGLINSKTLRRISTIAWRQGYQEYCYDIRKLAYKVDKKDPWNRSYLASIACYVDYNKVKLIPELQSKNSIERFLQICNQNSGSFAMSQAIIARYLQRKNHYKDSIEYLEKATNENQVSWHFRNYIISLIMSKYKTKDIRNKIKSFETDPDSKWNLRSNIRTQAIYLFINALLNIIDGKHSKESIRNVTKFFNVRNVAAFSDVSSINKFSCFHFTSNFKKLYPEKLEEIMHIYKIVYYFLGDSDPEMDNNINLQEEVLKDLQKYW